MGNAEKIEMEEENSYNNNEGKDLGNEKEGRNVEDQKPSSNQKRNQKRKAIETKKENAVTSWDVIHNEEMMAEKYKNAGEYLAQFKGFTITKKKKKKRKKGKLSGVGGVELYVSI